ncbi:MULTISPECIES: glycolate oxidase subunit GlcF [Methylosinus]|uniref:Glycolate oxidase iron-sulfur subunit n=1 Tax=Methylosinus trichosporium (strain ATCC 35070 / NCIMB 11131 / UNIQEM 75 / OB3b) TaxID=595536 RepID=A0A2D2CWU4_METT3|nr:MULTISPECIES: glycolate oxidase subunit GlcF [Methylosinus]ATQ67210.1 glycolate oxidase iron-sulfur subunit [Methylosinus trichosporium OB3b]OBS52225.1 2-hydroxy-acid oxidase [Methylosinus sp. 3S-1]
MQTHFSPRLLADSDMSQSETILRACVHCGFCTATCPTYLLTGDELDSPRGRIYLIKEMLENDRPADARTVRHVDRCLSCLSCMTTCPSSVHYMHLVDHARAHIEKTYRRPPLERLLRAALAFTLTRPALFRQSLRAAALARPFARLLPLRFAALFDMAPARLPPPSPVDRPQVFAAKAPRRMRVALLSGCAQTVLDTRIHEATVRLLTRLGAEVVVVKGAGCCGALPHHLGRTDESHALARKNIEAWTREVESSGLDRIVIDASGCGTTVKDYGHMFRDDAALAQDAAHVASLARDVTEVVAELGLAPQIDVGALRVAYHSACSLQHGQKIADLPMELLRRAGFDVAAVPESHICCGSAGTYNLLQPELATQLRARKIANIETLAPRAVAAGNLGCMMQIGQGTSIPILHTIELIDWACGGPRPAALQG